MPPHPARRWGSHCPAKGLDVAPKAGLAEYSTRVAQKGRNGLGFVAFVRFSDQLQAFQLRSTAKSANLFPGPKVHKPFLCNSPVK